MISLLKTGIVTILTLYGLDPNELLNGANSEKLKSLQKKRKSLKTSKRIIKEKLEEDAKLKFIDY
jgi:hypothetical protein